MQFSRGVNRRSEVTARPRRKDLEQAPKKLIDFFDKSFLQHFDSERILIVRTIPFERKALVL